MCRQLMFPKWPLLFNLKVNGRKVLEKCSCHFVERHFRLEYYVSACEKPWIEIANGTRRGEFVVKIGSKRCVHQKGQRER